MAEPREVTDSKAKPFVCEWRRQVLQSELASSTKLVLLALSDHMEGDGSSCYPSVRRLARDSSLHSETVSQHLRLAGEDGWFERKRRGRKGQGWNYEYEPLIPQSVRIARTLSEAKRTGQPDILPGKRTAEPDTSTGKRTDSPDTSDQSVRIEPTKACGSAVQRSPVEETTTTPPTPPPGESESEEAFERFWSAYPDREGGNPKKAARRAWDARLRDGAPAEELVQATVNYAGYCRDEGSVGTRFVKRASSFLGPDEEWREWLTPSRTNGKPPDNAVAAWEQVRRMVEEVSLQNLGPAFKRLDPAGCYALGELGEVRALKDLPLGAFLSKRREFLRAYRSANRHSGRPLISGHLS